MYFLTLVVEFDTWFHIMTQFDPYLAIQSHSMANNFIFALLLTVSGLLLYKPWLSLQWLRAPAVELRSSPAPGRGSQHNQWSPGHWLTPAQRPKEEQPDHQAAEYLSRSEVSADDEHLSQNGKTVSGHRQIGMKPEQISSIQRMTFNVT